MARVVRRGDLWLHQFGAPDRRRPVVVPSRDAVANRLHTVTVAPVTGIIRGIPSEVAVGVAEGLKHDSVVNLDHVQTVPREALRQWLGRLGAARMFEVCRAVNAAFGCEARMVRADSRRFRDPPGGVESLALDPA